MMISKRENSDFIYKTFGVITAFVCKWFLKTFYIDQRTLEKLVEVIEHEELLTYYGLSRTIILNEVEHAKKFNQIKVKFTS